MSSLSSMPIESRTTSGPAPAWTFCASVELAVGGRGRMDDQRAGVADIGEMREQLHVRHELDAGVIAALESEGEHRAGALRAVFLAQVVIAVAGAGPDSSPRRPCGWRQPLRDRQRIVAMPLHAQRQRLDAGRIRKALNGDSAGPMSRSASTRQAMAKAKLPNVSCSTMPCIRGAARYSIG